MVLIRLARLSPSVGSSSVEEGGYTLDDDGGDDGSWGQWLTVGLHHLVPRHRRGGSQRPRGSRLRRLDDLRCSGNAYNFFCFLLIVGKYHLFS